MIDAFTLPVDGWADAWVSYDMSIIGAAVAFIRDHGPVDDDRVLTVIRRAGIGADVRKASPIFDEDDGARRILNLLVADIDEVTRTDDGLLSVPADTTTVVSKASGRSRTVPTAGDRAADAARARHTEHLRRWVYKAPFATDWRDGIRRWNDDDIFDMAERINVIGYCGPPIVCDQHGVIIDGHLRAAALRLLDVDPDLHTEVRRFDDDLHRLAYVIAVHQQGKWFPTDLRNAIVSYVNRAARGSKETVSWPDDIATLIGRRRQSPPLQRGEEVSAAPPAPPPKPVAKPIAKPHPPKDSTAPYRPSLTGTDQPGIRFRDRGPRLQVATRLIQASYYNGDERWVPRNLLVGNGLAKFDYVLRRTGWFIINEVAWLFIPDNLTSKFTKGRVRRLNTVETGRLKDALARGASDYWDEWERLIEV